jgi:hypothetical protein
LKRVMDTPAFPIGVFVAAIVGVVLVLPDGGYLQRYVGVSLPTLIPFVILASGLYLAAQAVEWSKPASPTEQSNGALLRSIAGRLLRGWSYSVGLYALLIATPPVAQALADKYATAANTSRLDILADLAPWASGTFAFFVLVRAASMASQTVAQVFYVPRFTLIGLAGLYVLIGEQGFVTQDLGIDTPPFWTFVVVAALTYLAQLARRPRSVPGTWLDEEKGAAGRLVTWVAIVLLLATAAAGVTWTALNSAPSVSGLAVGGFDVYASKLYEIRLLASALVWVLMIAWSLRPMTTKPSGGETSAFIEAVAWASGAGLAWAIGTSLPPSPSGYLLVATTVAVGLLFTSLSALARIAIGRDWPVLEETANWLASSQWRAFVLGASLVVYGLFLRPLMYYSVWYAPILEWIAVISLAILILVKTTSAIRRHVETSQIVAIAPAWARHRQRITTTSDHHFVRVVELQREFINDGGLIGIWAYVAMVLVHNRVALNDMAHALMPLAEHYLDPPNRHWFSIPSRVEIQERNQRLQVVEETVKRLEYAIEHSPDRAEAVDSARLWALGSSILGSRDALPFVSALILASHQHGANVTTASIRWLRMLDAGRISVRWNLRLWQRIGAAKSRTERHEWLLNDSITQAMDSPSNRQVYVATLSRPFRILAEPGANSSVLIEVDPGSLFEVRAAEGEYHVIVTNGHEFGHVPKKRANFQPIDASYFEGRFEEDYEAIRGRGSRSTLR